MINVIFLWVKTKKQRDTVVPNWLPRVVHLCLITWRGRWMAGPPPLWSSTSGNRLRWIFGTLLPTFYRPSRLQKLVFRHSHYIVTLRVIQANFYWSDNDFAINFKNRNQTLKDQKIKSLKNWKNTIRTWKLKTSQIRFISSCDVASGGCFLFCLFLFIWLITFFSLVLLPFLIFICSFLYVFQITQLYGYLHKILNSYSCVWKNL